LKGKIVSYDSVNGVGKIIIKGEGIKPFNIDNWLDYDISPSVGLDVEFNIEENEIIDILSSESSGILIEQLNEDFNYTIPENLKIQEDISLNYCLEEFFTKFKKIALKYKDLLYITKQLPYKTIKRFVFTAYNNLLEIDFTINDKNLVDVKNSLEEIEYYYNKLLNEIKNPIFVILEKLVLNKQNHYQKIKKKYENNKFLITDYTKNTNLLEIKIEKLKKELEKTNKKSKAYQQGVNLLKSYKKKYVDLIDMAQNLKEENSNLIEDIIQFENVYKEIFQKFFNKEVSILLKILQKELDVLSYKFDSVLWENAKKSKQIQHFFREAKIEGSYSTKTFMKYYLKNLNTDKMNTKDSELLKVFNDLNVFNKSIVIYDKNRNRAREIALTIENLEHDSDVKIYDSFKDFVLYIKDNGETLDIVILEIEDYTESIIQKILPILKKLSVKVILFSETIVSDEVIKQDEISKKIKLLI